MCSINNVHNHKCNLLVLFIKLALMHGVEDTKIAKLFVSGLVYDVAGILPCIMSIKKLENAWKWSWPN